MRSNRDRYHDACHAMQSGVAAKMHIDGAETTTKHLRVGVNSAMVESAAIVQLLIDKKIITMEDWEKYLANAMETEKIRYEEYLGMKLA